MFSAEGTLFSLYAVPFYSIIHISTIVTPSQISLSRCSCSGLTHREGQKASLYVTYGL